MKKIAKVIITAALISTMNLTALAADIPGESLPENATYQSMNITENLISPILCEVENGLGYGEANAKAREIGPTLPRYIVNVIIILPIVFKLLV